MAAKLTLRLDESVIRDAKRAARARGVRLSEMVSGYFRADPVRIRNIGHVNSTLNLLKTL